MKRSKRETAGVEPKRFKFSDELPKSPQCNFPCTVCQNECTVDVVECKQTEKKTTISTKWKEEKKAHNYLQKRMLPLL